MLVLIERSSSLLVRLLEESKSGKQALREVRLKLFILAIPGRNEEDRSLGRWRLGYSACFSWRECDTLLISVLTNGWVQVGTNRDKGGGGGRVTRWCSWRSALILSVFKQDLDGRCIWQVGANVKVDR